MGNLRNFQHAEHNREVYLYLCQKPEFCDWIITTAFYSAIHYVRFRMLPFEVTYKTTKTVYSEFESLFNALRKDNEGRHGFQLKWVGTHYSEIKFSYRRLHELSNEARYINYQFPSEIIPEIYTHLERIRIFCAS